MATILEPTTAEVLAAGYLFQREKVLHGLVVAREAIDRLHDVVTSKSGESADEIAYIINRAQETISECLLLGGYYEEKPSKLWLWKNFVDGKPEYWAFDNPFPVHLDNDDPQTLGEPCGYAIFKSSRPGRIDVSEAEVLRRIAGAKGIAPNAQFASERSESERNGKLE